MPLPLQLNDWPAALLIAIKRFNSKNGWVMSSHIAMSLMLALFPFILFTVAMAGAITTVLSQDVEVDEVISLLFDSWPEEVSVPILRELNAVLAASTPQLATAGGLLALLFASNGVEAVRVAMVNAYHDEDTRPFWKARLICLGLVILGGAGLMAAAIFNLALPLYVRYVADLFPNVTIGTHWQGGLHDITTALVPLVGVIAAHIILPGKVHRLTEILPGALLTVVVWWGGGLAFAYYVGSFATYSATYAGLAGAMAALLFLYFNAVVLILGAEFNGALMRHSHLDSETEDETEVPYGD